MLPFFHSSFRDSFLALISVVMFFASVSVGQDCALCAQGSGAGQPLSTGNTAHEMMPQILPSGNNSDEFVMRKMVNEVTVLFSVTKKGKPVDDLALSDIELQDDKKPPSAILDFRAERDLPLRLALLIDTSDSVTERFAFEQESAIRFLQQVIRRNMDQAFVMGFNSKAQITQDLTDDPDLLARGVAKLRDGGSTALFDAIAVASEKLARTHDSGTVARVIVLLTDGDDTASRRSYSAAAQMAQGAGVTIFAVSTNPIDRETPGDVKLKAFADETGGKAMFPGEASDLPKAFKKVEQEIRSRYAVSYRPASFEANGHYRRIKIEARKLGKKLHVRARRGYYARMETTMW